MAFLLTKLLFVLLKHSCIMAIKIRFYGIEPNHCKTFLECTEFLGVNAIGIIVDNTINAIPIVIDKQTSIRLVRELRKQIALLD